MEQTKRKRYYKEGEKIWIKEHKTSGVIKFLEIKPEDNVYKATVEFKKNGTLVEGVFNLWEINKFRKPNKNLPTLLFAKVRPDAIIPSKNDEDAGYDIYANFEEDEIIIEPNSIKLIPTGIASCVSDDFALVGRERGSTGVLGMSLRSAVIDSGYRGEIFIPINNTSSDNISISKKYEELTVKDGTVYYPYNKAIAQLLLVPVPKVNVKEIPYEELKSVPSKRGTGALGSSNK